MSVTYGFYNSLNGDRKYNAEQISSIFDGLIVDGVFASIGTAFAVKAAGALTINVGIGRAWFNHTWTLNDSILPLTAPESEVLLDRIDAVVLEVNGMESVRENSIKIVTGTPSSAPVRPTLENEGNVHQYPLAYIYRKFGSTVITQADITNMVGTESTPFVTGIIQTISLDELLGQWQAQLDQFVANEEADFSEWSRQKRIEFDNWKAAQQQDYENWSDTQKQDYLTWISEQETTFNNWATDQMSSEEEWIQSMQNTFLSWFNEMQTQLSGDVAGNLQLQIDKEEVKRILLSGFADGSKAFNEDGTVIVSTADDGRTLTKTFTNNFLTMTTVLKSTEGGEIARMVKQFSSDGTLIDITTTYA